MPISAERFERIDDEGDAPGPGANADAIRSFLRANADRAFTQSEIAEATDVERESVGPTLVRLRDAGRVDHRGTYWRISDHERSLDAATAHGDAVAAGGEAESFDYDEWQDHAEDPRDASER